MQDIELALREELRDAEYAESYAESFLDMHIATQIKVLREQRKMTQLELARAIGTTQTGISRIENVNYALWSKRTLIKLARAFNVRLKVSFESYGSLPIEVTSFNRASLERVPREEDPGLASQSPFYFLDDILPIKATAVDSSLGRTQKEPGGTYPPLSIQATLPDGSIGFVPYNQPYSMIATSLSRGVVGNGREIPNIGEIPTIQPAGLVGAA